MKILSNTAMSVDGRIGTKNKEHFYLGSKEDRLEMSRLRASADAILVGGNTFRNWPYPLLPGPQDALRDYLKNPLLNVIISRTMSFAFSDEYLNEKRIRPIFLTGNNFSPNDFPFEIRVSAGDVTPEWIVATLQKLNVKTLLIEAGGDLNFQFLKSGLLDEMHVTLCPKIIGGRNVPSLVDGDGFDRESLKKMKLLNVVQNGDELFLHYQVKK